MADVNNIVTAQQFQQSDPAEFTFNQLDTKTCKVRIKRS